jgi:tRNA dimethylallyltransferase
VTATPDLLCIMGPTASGKTALAERLAEHVPCELVSVDSALVYRGMDIGAARPDSPHHLVDIRDPADSYSAADFAADANGLIGDIRGRDRLPLLVGGTMLYFRALLEGLSPVPAADPEVRKAIENEAAEYGWPHVHARLAEVDPAAAARIHPNHSQRIARALEVYRASGRPITEWQQASGAPGVLDRYRVLQIAICPQDRAVLHERIAVRFGQMMRAGFLEEVRALHERGDLDLALPALRAVGYRQLWHFLDDEYNLETAIQRGIAATRQLAKRQLTWLRKWPDLAWIYTDRDGNIIETTLSEQGQGDPWKGQDPANPVLNYLGINPM